MKYFDTHTHTNSKPLDSEFDKILEQIKQVDMAINIVGCNKQDCLLAVQQAKQDSLTYCSLAIHPNDVKNYDLQDTIAFLKELVINNRQKVLCIGECGLDYYYDNDEQTKAIQKEWFKKQIELAIELDLPIMMHIRDAHDDAIEIIKQYQDKNAKWIVHCFTANEYYAKQYVELGCYLSIPGVVTFKKSDELRQAVKVIPLDKLLTETDAPWLAPVPYRGKTNYPYYVIETNKYLSDLLQIDLETLNQQLVKNALKVFNIKC